MKTLEMGQLELGQEVKVTFNSGRVLEGKVMDFSKGQTHFWIENEVDIYHVIMHHATVELIEAEVVQTEKAPNSLKTLKELKEAIADELKGQWYEEIENVKVAVYNTEEDGAEVYDCEVQIVLDNGESIYPTFGTFYNEKDALKHARAMRTKLKRTYDISEQVFVYTC
ncbi:hypothetical protein BCB4_0061 [Bacillus phage B4]|uniref:Uncharacterized protein n=2 Tax=Bequatrovirus B4 TaxID=1918005 RepID=J9PQG7_9CAUD|nr:hypothetical protein BCB4_0061 [Bacillus phage B4]YP_009783655.1 hypothetical protein QLX26_gp059 [Bacillus phage B5S]AEW47293.1 hypothetical protein B5S_0059 [Bacillus phage B5S]AEZ65854.1 hypothetical protein BCB4_0061 [Bacillus phage B4]